MTLPERSQIVICGGGIAGASTAFHLAKLGITDITLIERHQLTSGTTWHAAGLIMQLRSTHSLTELAKYNVELYSDLERQTGVPTGFKQNGTLGVCRTSDRLIESRKAVSIAKSFGIEAYMVSPSEAREIYSPLNPDAISGAVYIPKDGQTNPVDTAMSLIAGARKLGVRIIENCAAAKLRHLPSKEFLIETREGSIRCETLVLACGIWTRNLASELGVNVPLYPCEHYYVVTEPSDLISPNLPVLRDTDGYSYVKEDAGRWLVGAFELVANPIDFKDLPDDLPNIELPENWNQFELPFSKAAEILPDLNNIGVARFFCGPESFTPDLMFMLGEAPNLKNCFICAGFSSEGIELSPGAGRALAEWIVDGEPSIDLGYADIGRFHSFQNNARYLRKRSSEVVGLHYKMHWPHRQKESARNVRKSVLHDRWKSLNANFGEAVGWERPMWFAPPGKSNANRYSHKRPNWFEFTALECKVSRQSAVVIDQSSFGKFLIQGKGACELLQTLAARDVDIPVGGIVYTHMLNKRGGVEMDMTVNRLREELFLIVTSATSHPRDLARLTRHSADDSDSVITDVTSNYAVLSVQGPKSREILSELSNADFGDEAFPFSTSQRVEIGYGLALANRLTFIGELGWELFIDTEFAQDIFDRIIETGTAFGLKPAGYHALEHLRCEQSYREFDHELTPEDTLLEAGLGFSVSLDKPFNFIGKDALLRQLERNRFCKRLVNFQLLDPEPVLFGEEPVRRDGRIVGYLSSSAYGFNLGASVGMGYVFTDENITEDWITGGNWEIESACERYSAAGSLKPLLDPFRKRVRSIEGENRSASFNG